MAAKGLTLNISTPKRNLRYKDVAAGEVWVCSGQSNMAFKTMSMVSEERSEVWKLLTGKVIMSVCLI